MSIIAIEQAALAALKSAEGFFDSDPNAKALADAAKLTIATTKADAIGLAADGIRTAVTSIRTPTLGASAAALAGADAAQYVSAKALTYAAPVEADIDKALTINGGVS